MVRNKAPHPRAGSELLKEGRIRTNPRGCQRKRRPFVKGRERESRVRTYPGEVGFEPSLFPLEGQVGFEPGHSICVDWERGAWELLGRNSLARS